MNYIVIEEFPEGDFNIPILDNGEQAIFEDINEAVEFNEELQNGYVLPLVSVAPYTVLGIRDIEQLYKKVSDKIGVEFEELKSSRLSLVMLAKHSLRYFLYEYCKMSYQDIAATERYIFDVSQQANHTTIMNSIQKVKNDPLRYKDFIAYIRSI